MIPEQAVSAAIALCLGGAGVTLVAARRRAQVAGWLALAVTAASAALVGLAVATVLLDGPSPEPYAPWRLEAIGFAPRFHVDGLSAVFLALAALVAVPAALHAVGYLRLRHGDAPPRRYHPCVLLFLAAMYGLVSTTDMMWFFFVFWQLMTLPGYALIRCEPRPEHARAANRYLVMMQLACAATMVGAELLVHAGRVAGGGAGPRYDFAAVSAALPSVLATRPLLSAAAFALFLAGFGVKMGMWPFGQVWLPDAHPAAPSPVSALLSGVMIKTGVYGLLRYFLWLVPPEGAQAFPLARWGTAVALLGGVTLFTGTAQALAQVQTKRLLAFHSVGQIGYVLLGAGTCMVALAAPGPLAQGVAALGLAGALFHVLNHGLFKALLFLDAGALLCATGTQDLDRMGGLARRMPLTALSALVASLAISGVPPLNGFASKWALYAAAVEGHVVARWLPLLAVLALLTSAFTLASFVKFFGASFLARTSDLVRAREAARGRLEVGWTLQAPQLFLAALCVLLGVVPAVPLGLLARALAASRGGLAGALAEHVPLAGAAAGVEALGGRAALAPLAVVALLAALLALSAALAHLGDARRRAVEPWLCGYAREADVHRYAAHHLYAEVKRSLRWLGGTGRHGDGGRTPRGSPP